MASIVSFHSLRHLLGALATAVLASAPALAAAGGMVVGSGKAVTEQRSVGSFQAVTLTGAMKVVLRQGAKEAVEVRADDNLLPLIETTVVERAGVPTLEIGTRRGASYSTHSRMVVTVDVVQLKALTLTGSGDMAADGLKTADLQVKVQGSGDVDLRRLAADTLGVRIAGSGDMSASGHAGRLDVAIAGSGDLVARDLVADDASVSIVGSGDARIQARKTLAVTIAGSGDVDYTGDAAVKTTIAGSGSVKKH